MITSLDHIAIAVPDLQKAITRFSEDLGLNFNGQEKVHSSKTEVAFFPIKGTQIELVHPINHEGPIQHFIEKYGAGLHHLCFQSDNLDEDIKKLRSKGYHFTSEEPSLGAHNTRVIFIHPKCFDGVLVELNEVLAD